MSGYIQVNKGEKTKEFEEVKKGEAFEWHGMLFIKMHGDNSSEAFEISYGDIYHFDIIDLVYPVEMNITYKHIQEA